MGKGDNAQYGLAAGKILWNFGRFLDEPSASLGFRK